MTEETSAHEGAQAVQLRMAAEWQANEPAVQQIVSQLGEHDPMAVKQIQNIVNFVGPAQALAFLRETLEVEAQGGMLIASGKRRRTPGGVFFHLVRTKGPDGINQCLVPHKQKKQHVPEPKPVLQKPAPAPLAQMTWDERTVVLDEISNEKGTTSTVKMTLIGRPGKIADKGTCIVTVMQANKVPALPKGLPVPPAVTTNYVVYIAAKQWKNVAGVVKDEEDVLIVEGFPQMDAQTGSIAVFATNVTTKKLQAAKRQQQQQAAQAQGEDGSTR